MEKVLEVVMFVCILNCGVVEATLAEMTFREPLRVDLLNVGLPLQKKDRGRSLSPHLRPQPFVCDLGDSHCCLT